MTVTLLSLLSHPTLENSTLQAELLHKINKHLILHCHSQVQSKVAQLSFDLISQTLTNGLSNVELNLFQKQVKAALPLLLVPNSTFDPIRVSQIHPDLISPSFAHKFSSLSVVAARSLLECLLSGNTFKNEDLLEEHLDNPRAIKDIAQCITSLSSSAPETLFEFLKTSVEEVVLRMK